MILSINMWFQTLMRQFFFNIDKIVYNFISTLYELLISIARTSVLSQADILDMADRVYKLLAVFMIFKVTFSLIMYVVNPDDFTDNSRGIGKLGTNIIISLALLVLTPYIFNYAFRLQTIILEDNSLAVLIFGDEMNSDKNPINSAGDTISYITMTPFFTPNTSIDRIGHCTELTKGRDEEGNQIINDECFGLDSNFEPLESDTSKTMYQLTRNDSSENEDFSLVTLQTYAQGIQKKNIGLTFRQEMATAITTDDEFVMEYKYVFSTILGVVVILLLLTFCLDVALRSVKLSFLQLIAPIPIISLVDPKSGKDGLFKQWYQMCFKTYISLFVRLLALFFAIYIIDRVDEMVDIVDGTYVSNMYIKVFVIIGVLMFAKQLPQILSGLGIKLDGDGKFNLNPLKKFTDEVPGGKVALGVGAAGLAGAAALGTNMLAKKGIKGRVFGGIAGAFSATGRGLQSAVKGQGFGKTFSSSYGAAMQARVNRADRGRYGISGIESMYNRAQQAMHIETEGQRLAREIKDMEEFSSATSGLKAETDSMVEKFKGNMKFNGSKEFETKSGKLDLSNITVGAAERLSQVLENKGDYEAASKLSSNIAVRRKTISEELQKVASGASLDDFNNSIMDGLELKDDKFARATAYYQDANEIYNNSKVVKGIVNSVKGSGVSAYMEAGDKAKNAAIRQKGEARRQQMVDQQSQKK